MSHETRTVVFFDALGTLFELTPPNVIFSGVLTTLGHEVDERGAAVLLLRANRWRLDPSRQQARTAEEERGERETYVRLVLEDMGRPGDADLGARLVEEAYWARWARPFPDAESVLRELRRRYPARGALERRAVEPRCRAVCGAGRVLRAHVLGPRARRAEAGPAGLRARDARHGRDGRGGLAGGRHPGERGRWN